MKSPYNFIVTPYNNEEYCNTKEVAGVKITINTSIEVAKYVNRLAVVLETPIHYDGDISIGDVVILHHNIFRTYLDMKGRQTKSPEFFRDKIYIVDPSRIYMYDNGNGWIPHLNYCFVRPIDRVQDELLHSVEEEEKHKGILVYPNKHQEKIGLNKGDLIAFTKNSEYAFDVDGEKLYRMYDRDVVLKLN